MKKIRYSIVISVAVLMSLVVKSRYRITPEAFADDGPKHSAESTIPPMLVRQDAATWRPSPDEIEQSKAISANLYGKVVDQYGKPVPRAVVVCQPNFDPYKSTPGRKEITARDDGTFEFTAPNAPTVSFYASAPGYYSTDKSHEVCVFAEPPKSMPESMRVEPTKTSLDNRKLFVLRKIENSQPLIHRSYHEVLTSHSTYLIGTAPTHSIQVTYWFDPKVERIHKVREWPIHNWGVELSVEGGGLMPCKEPDEKVPESFIAPENGYSSTLKFQYGAENDDATYLPDINRQFFVKFADNTYARVAVLFESDAKRPLARIESWFGPSGGRSTEFDSTKSVIR